MGGGIEKRPEQGVRFGSMVNGSNIAGACIAIFGSIASNLGTNVQKQAHLSQADVAEDKKRHYTKMPFWWCGMALTIFGAFADFGALAIASQSLVTGLGGGTTLLANVAIARFWNKEKILRTDLVSSRKI